MDKFFSIFGKVTLVLIVLSVFVYGGYYIGKNSLNFKKPNAVQTENSNNEIYNNNEQKVAVTTPSTTPTIELKTVVAGVSKEKGLSFDEYSVLVPNDWTTKKESQTGMDEKLVITKGDNSISIFQAATGGALCLYPGDSEFEGPSSKFETFVNLTTKDNRNLRRSGSLNGTSFSVCQKSGDGSYQQPTNYGHISIKLEVNYQKQILEEIDQIVSSLKKI